MKKKHQLNDYIIVCRLLVRKRQWCNRNI